jgi:hypothetical protein
MKVRDHPYQTNSLPLAYYVTFRGRLYPGERESPYFGNDGNYDEKV